MVGGDGNPKNKNCVENGQFSDMKLLFNENNVKNKTLMDPKLNQSNLFCIKRKWISREKNGMRSSVYAG